MKRVTPEAQPKRSVLLYGPPKTGKTAAACSAPGPVLLVNCDLPNASWYSHQKYGDKIVEVHYEGFRETLMEIGACLQRGDLKFNGLAKQPVQTIVVDPAGELYRHMLEEFSDHAISPSLPKYQIAQTHLERFCRGLCRNTDINFVLTAHEHPVQDEATGEVEKLLWAGTKSNSATLSQKLMGMVDIVGYTGVVETEGGGHEYVAQLVNGKGRRGGDRFDGLGTVRSMDLTEWFATPLMPVQAPEEEKAA